jgi:hypothetical protein
MAVLAAPFNSKTRLEAENAVLWHQLIVLRRRVQGRVRLTNNDHWFFIQLYRWISSILNVLTIVRPETLVRWLASRLSRPGRQSRLKRRINLMAIHPVERTNFQLRVSLPVMLAAVIAVLIFALVKL